MDRVSQVRRVGGRRGGEASEELQGTHRVCGACAELGDFGTQDP